jgi:hypothetical protein
MSTRYAHAPRPIALPDDLADKAKRSSAFSDSPPARPIAAPPPPLRCSWDRWGERLVTKCADPSPTLDKTGCAHGGALKAVAL